MSEKKISPAQQRALDKYKAKVNRFTVDFPPTDSELWEHLQKQPNKQGYIKALIRADMANDAPIIVGAIDPQTAEEIVEEVRKAKTIHTEGSGENAVD